ncbi:MAG: hypothetical protein V4731_06235 [Pseudomonadota bacterium]
MSTGNPSQTTRRKLPAAQHEDQAHVLKLIEGTGNESEATGLRVVVSTSGEPARQSAAMVTFPPLRAPWGLCDYRWEMWPRNCAIEPCDLWLHIGSDRLSGLNNRERAPASAIFVDLAGLHFRNIGSPADVKVQARLARALIEIHFVPGHVCVDFADVAKVLPRATTVIQSIGEDASKAVNTFHAALLDAAPQSMTGALLIVTFPLGGGKLSHSKQAIKTLQAAVNPSAEVIFATTQDPELPPSTLRITLVAAFAELD